MKLPTSKGGYKDISGHALLGTLLVAGVLLGFLTGYTFMETADVIFFRRSNMNLVGTTTEEAGGASSGISLARSESNLPRQLSLVDKQDKRDNAVRKDSATTPVAEVKKLTSKKWAGNTIHSVLTSGGDTYQNYQTRIFWSSYKLAQKMPGGERMTGFTRILHSEKPDYLMNEIPTFMANKNLVPNAGDYPVKNRPIAIMNWLEAVAADPDNMLQGAWILMLECDYVWFKPMQVPGDAYDQSVLSVQYEYDYIYPAAEDLAMCITRFYGENRDRKLIPRSGPAPVMMRLDEWLKIGPAYKNVSAAIEADPECREKLGWVREMYAWDVALAQIPELRVKTSKTPDSLLIGQPPFEETRGEAAMYHYTWGPYFYDTRMNKTLVYKWEKREHNSMDEVKKPLPLPMPPPYRDGILLEFDAPLTPKRYDIIIDFINVMNNAISVVPELQVSE